MMRRPWLQLGLGVIVAFLVMSSPARAQVYGTAPRGTLVPTFKPTGSDIIDVLPAFIVQSPGGIRPVYYANYDTLAYNPYLMSPAAYAGPRYPITWAHAGWGYSYPLPYDNMIPAGYGGPYSPYVTPAAYGAAPGPVIAFPVAPASYPATAAAPSPRLPTAEIQILVVDPSADVWVNGMKSDKSGLNRGFITPEMDPGKTVSFKIRAKWTQNGKQYDQTRTVNVQAGQEVGIAFAVDEREPLPPPTKK